MQRGNLRFKRPLNGLIFLICLRFVLWQCYLSFQKFLDKPRSTSVKIEYDRDWPTPPTPGFTICPTDHNLERNEDVLDQCQVFFSPDGMISTRGP